MGWKAPTYAVHIVIKVIIYKSRGYLSILEQPTIECVFLAYLAMKCLQK